MDIADEAGARRTADIAITVLRSTIGPGEG